jgi:hypothetical protein
LVTTREPDPVSSFRSSTVAHRVGTGCIHDNNVSKGRMSGTFQPQVTSAGEYEVFLVFTPHANRARNVPVATTAAGATKTALVNQQQGGRTSLGKFKLGAGKPITVKVSNNNTDGFVVVDGLQLVSQ